MLLVSARFDNVDPATEARLQTLLQRDRPRDTQAGLATQGAKRSAGKVQRAAEQGKPAGKQGTASSVAAQAQAQDIGQAAQPQPEPENGASPHAETGQLSESGAQEANAAGGHAARAPRRAHHVEAKASSNVADSAEEHAHDQQGLPLNTSRALAAGAETEPDAEQGLEPWPGAEPGAQPGIQLVTEPCPEQRSGPGPQPMGESEVEPPAERCSEAEQQPKDEPGPDASNGPQAAADSNEGAREQRQEEPLLFCLPQLGMWTKLRPFVRAFLDQVCGLQGLHVTAALMLLAADAASVARQE